MKKRSLYFVLGIFIVQLITLLIFCSDLVFINALFFLLCLLLFFGNFGLLLYQTDIMHEIIGRLGDWVKHMLPVLFLSVMIGAADTLLWYLFLQDFKNSLFWLMICLCMLFSALTIIFAMGAAMTILHREKKE